MLNRKGAKHVITLLSVSFENIEPLCCKTYISIKWSYYGNMPTQTSFYVNIKYDEYEFKIHERIDTIMLFSLFTTLGRKFSIIRLLWFGNRTTPGNSVTLQSSHEYCACLQLINAVWCDGIIFWRLNPLLNQIDINILLESANICCEQLVW